MKLLPSSSLRRICYGFSLIELLVALVTVAILASVLLPALASSKANGKAQQCMNNKRQLTLAWQMYTADSADQLMTATLWIDNSAGYLDWTTSPMNTNLAALINPAQALIASYNKNAAVFKCPADAYQSPANSGPRDRSISLNIALAGTPTILGKAPDGSSYIAARKIYDLAKPGPAGIFVLLDEHPDSINDSIFALNPGAATGSEKWRDYPASYHNAANAVSFADGHVEMHSWQVTSGTAGTVTTTLPVLYVNYVSSSSASWGIAVLNNSTDFDWLQARMPRY